MSIDTKHAPPKPKSVLEVSSQEVEDSPLNNAELSRIDELQKINIHTLVKEIKKNGWKLFVEKVSMSTKHKHIDIFCAETERINLLSLTLIADQLKTDFLKVTEYQENTKTMELPSISDLCKYAPREGNRNIRKVVSKVRGFRTSNKKKRQRKNSVIAKKLAELMFPRVKNQNELYRTAIVTITNHIKK